MRLVLVIFRYFPYGGLQRDLRLLAEAAVKREHNVTILCQRWSGEPILGANLVTFAPLPIIGKISSPWRNRRFFHQVCAWLNDNPHDYIFGMNKMPFLYGYFQGDECFAELIKAQRPFWYQFTPRARHFLANEHAVFASKTSDLFMLSEPAVEHFCKHYGKRIQSRMVMLKPSLPSEQIWRKPMKLAVDENEIKLLFVATNFWLKGLDRVIRAIASLENRANISLTVIGGGNISKFQMLAKKQHVKATFLGARDDVIAHMRNADLLIHPARLENAGMVILEALANALPVLTTANVGYAVMVEKYNAGCVINALFKQSELNTTLQTLVNDTAKLTKLAGNAYHVGKTLDNTTIAEQILDSILLQQ